MIPTVTGGANIIARVGGFDMADNLDKQRYAQDFARVAAIIATNNQLGAIAGVANGNTVVIPNGVNLERFKPAEKNPNFGRPFTIGFAGNVWGQGAQYKGWQLFVQAGIDLTMDGSKDFAQHYLLHGLNQIAHDQMPEEFYHTIDALVLPSKGEGCSNVVSEALACGVPPILTKVGFHGERLEHEKHCLFVSRDVGEIVSAARRLQSDPDLRLRMAGECRAFAEQYHDVRKVAAQYDAVFKSVLAAKEQKGVA
jgi:glycosyltransferase involved in cell wall biosynthesis